MSARTRWLSHAPLGDDGVVCSWVNTAHPGYAYPEAAGLWLRFAAWQGLPGSRIEPVRSRLRRDVVDGMVGRGGTLYAFDTAVALGGLVASGTVGPVERAMFEAVVASLEGRRAVRGEAPVDRWSTQWTPHMLKVIAPLRLYARATGDPRARGAAERLLEDFIANGKVEAWLQGDFYTHACCYALEGWLVAQAWGLGEWSDELGRYARELARLQREDGLLPAFRSGGASRADATAQAIRLWSVLGRERYAESIAKGLSALAGLDAGGGGLRYETGSDDVNTWATVFALQAEAWAAGVPDVGELW